MLKQLTLLLALGSILVVPAKAGISLSDALSAKKVCEKADGYIQATTGNDAEVDALVKQVNIKRTTVYADIAAKEGLDPVAVGAAMAEQEKAANPGKFCR